MNKRQTRKKQFLDSLTPEDSYRGTKHRYNANLFNPYIQVVGRILLKFYT